ncbi:MAG: thymidylate synthase [Bacillota bacterium]
MQFIPLYFADKLTIINPRGYVAVVTLWSQHNFVLKKMQEAGIDLSPTTSPVAVVGNLYGNGLKHLLRNLLYNPQLSHLLICGRDRSGSQQELVNFFQRGLEDYRHLGVDLKRIIGTNRVLDNSLTPEHFTRPPRITCAGDLRTPESLQKLKSFFASLPASDCRPAVTEADRMRVPLPEVQVGYYPSNPRQHTIVAPSMLPAWQELIFRLVRFGHPVQLRKGQRQELQNVKVVVENPAVEDAALLARHGFSLEKFLAYQRELLQADPPGDDTSYTYGHRLRGYFGLDGLEKCIERLRRDPQDRHCYIALWDSARDLATAGGHPCLVSVYFRFYDERLTLTAVFRTHNALDGWPENFYGLLGIRDYVSRAVGMPGGAITVFSHSISIDLNEYDRARRIADSKGFAVNLDPNGEFRITIDGEEIVLQHWHGSVMLQEYRARQAEKLQHMLYRDGAVSDINHALYLGRQLGRAEMCIKLGLPFEE